MTQRDNNISYQIDSILTDVSQDQVQEDKQIRQINEDHLLIKEEPYQLVLNYREGFDFASLRESLPRILREVRLHCRGLGL